MASRTPCGAFRAAIEVDINLEGSNDATCTLSQGFVTVMSRQLSQENVVWIGVCAGYLLAITTKDEKSVALRLDKDTLEVVKKIALQKQVRLPNSE